MRYTSLGQKEVERASTRSKAASAKGRRLWGHCPCGCGPRESEQAGSVQMTCIPSGVSRLAASLTLGGYASVATATFGNGARRHTPLGMQVIWTDPARSED